MAYSKLFGIKNTFEYKGSFRTTTDMHEPTVISLTDDELAFRGHQVCTPVVLSEVENVQLFVCLCIATS